MKQITDIEATLIKEAKKLLQDYVYWKVKKQSFSNWIYHSEATLSEGAEQADFECQFRLKTIEAMRAAGHDKYADILTLRFIQRKSILMACTELESRYGQYVSERSFNRYQNKALLIFAHACPRRPN